MTFPLVGLLRAGLLTLYLPASRLKKEPGDSDSDLSGLRDWRSYMSEAKSWINIPPYARRAGRTWQQGFAPGGFPVPRGLMVGWLISYQGDQKRGILLTCLWKLS